MHPIRSVLWIGPASGLASSGALDCPSLDVTWVPNLGEALSLAPASFDVEVLDGAGSDLAERVKRLRRSPRRSPVLVRTPEPAEAELLAAGARGVLATGNGPGAVEHLLRRIDELAEEQPWHGSEDGETTRKPLLPGMIGSSRAMQGVFDLVERASQSSATVLIAGETGTGKEVIARAVHASGPRSAKPFVAVNCAAFPDSLLESELFGHVRGAFTGADRDKPGLFSEANGGTVFLDEIGETSPPLQANLLRVLQEREVRPVGSSHSIPLDVRVIAASNRSLRDAAKHGGFREDLYYRLAVFPITVPPLRERREDILPLAEHFLSLHGQREDKPGCRLSQPAAHLLLAHGWPGNVRELENEMQRALALADPGALVGPKLLSEAVRDIISPIQQSCRAGDSLRDNMNRIEAWLIRRALEQHGGRRAASARKLGITREGLYKKMKRLGVD
ncbi:MAG: sigma 54-interacting transcriptional regulator [Myxococcota bacterium]|nr:sigma 54-interacting transcriptional regulator [Myxococcota bacterium]